MASVQKEICGYINQYIKENIQGFSPFKAMEVGVGTGFLTGYLLDMFPCADWVLNDINSSTKSYVEQLSKEKNVSYLWADAEEVEFPEGLDFIASASTVQWFDDLGKFIAKCSDSTSKGGYLVMSTFGKDNFCEIKTLTGEGLEYYTISELEDMLCEQGYELVFREEYIRKLSFNTPLEVLHHIKSTGVNGIKRSPWTRSKLDDFSVRYSNLCPKGVELTYHPIILIARKR